MPEKKSLPWNNECLTKFVKALKNDGLSNIDIFDALIVYKAFSDHKNPHTFTKEEMVYILTKIGLIINYDFPYFDSQINDAYPLSGNGERKHIIRELVIGGKDFFRVNPLFEDELKEKYLNEKYLHFLNYKKPLPEIKDDHCLITLPDLKLNSKKGLSSKLIPQLIKEANYNYDLRLYNSCALICRRICEILVIEALEKYNNGKNDSDKIKIEGENGYLGFGYLIGQFKNCKFSGVKKDKHIQECLDNVKKYGDIGAHHKFRLVEEKDIKDYIKPDIKPLIESLLHIGGFYE